MKKVLALVGILFSFWGCTQEEYSGCLKGKLIKVDCWGTYYVQILSKKSPVQNLVSFGSKGSMHYKEVKNVFMTDTITIPIHSSDRTFLFKLQPFVEQRRRPDAFCPLILDVCTLKGKQETYSVGECD